MTIQTVMIRGRSVRTIGEESIGGRRYLLLDRLNTATSEAYRVFDRHAGLDGAFAALHILPAGRATEQRLRVLDRLGRGGEHFPKLQAFDRNRQSVRVVFEWVDGENLRAFIADMRKGSQARMSATEATKRIAKLAHGVSHLASRAHAVHGDIKPANLILTPRPHRLVLIDFGSAWPVERTLKRELGDGVTAPYAAPEQLEGSGFVDWRADVFALSVVWYELLTLQIPYDGLGGQAGIAENREDFAGTFVPPSQLSPDAKRIPASIWRPIDAAIGRGLALNADDRFADRRSWLDALDAIQSALRAPSTLSTWDRRWLSWLEKIFRRPK